MADSPFHLFGIRHHGPGCARSLLRALEALDPDCLLIEGPPEGEAMLPLMTEPTLVPPVAMLIYNPEAARQAVFYPFASFSPEWNALRHMLALKRPVRFIDLPVGQRFALMAAESDEDEDATGAERADEVAEAAEAADEDEGESTAAEALPMDDPLDWLGRAAGYGDGESWWNHMVEERGDSLELFAAIREAMCSVRAEAPERTDTGARRREMLREAHMRKCLRQARKDGFERIAVVCGAWHVPALLDLPPAKADNDLLKGLGKVRVEATWVPWSHPHLTRASGYGAGVEAPGWYEHLWRSAPENRAVGWLAQAARLFREQDLDCSSAHLIEAVRLADTLAALRGRPQPGLDELGEALRTVVCMGDSAPMRLIHEELTVGRRIGSTPEDAPAVPLQRDLEQQQKTLRFKPEAVRKPLDLDLRQPMHLARSHLLHRLALLGIDWGVPSRGARGAKGSFHEVWTLQWQPEMALAVIEAGRWGNTVVDAATARAIDVAAQASGLPALAELIDRVLLADLPAAVGPVSRALEDRAAVANDVLQLLAAMPPLANVARYGNVRQTDAGMVARVLERLVPRAAIGLAAACASLDDAAAETMRAHVAEAHQALRLMDAAELIAPWHEALRRVAEPGGVHGQVAGLAARLLFDDQVDGIDQTSARMSRALSAALDPGPAAAWLDGFLNRSAMVLLHDDALWRMVDDWLAGLSEAHFMRELAMLRRAFAGFTEPERRQLGERARRTRGAGAASASTADWDMARAMRVLPVLRALWGIEA